jgi:hypothetical protein
MIFCWSKWFRIQFEGFKKPVFKAFMELVSYGKTLPTDPDCLPFIKKGLIRHVTYALAIAYRPLFGPWISGP